MNEDIYEQLRQAIDKIGLGFSATKTGVEIRLLKKIFTEEDARMWMHLTDKLETPEEIGKRRKTQGFRIADYNMGIYPKQPLALWVLPYALRRVPLAGQ
jgi:hypothetical protein